MESQNRRIHRFWDRAPPGSPLASEKSGPNTASGDQNREFSRPPKQKASRMGKVAPLLKIWSRARSRSSRAKFSRRVRLLCVEFRAEIVANSVQALAFGLQVLAFGLQVQDSRSGFRKLRSRFRQSRSRFPHSHSSLRHCAEDPTFARQMT